MSIYRVVMIILVNWVTDFQPPNFHKSGVLTPCFKILGKTLTESVFCFSAPGSNLDHMGADIYG